MGQERKTEPRRSSSSSFHTPSHPIPPSTTTFPLPTGDLTERTLAPNPDEVSECFTVPLATLLKDEHWNDDADNATVVFVGGPHIVWGLTAYICRKFITDILCRYEITC